MGQDAPWESNKLSHGAFFYPPQQTLRVIKLLRGRWRCCLPCLPMRTWAATGVWQQTCPAEIPVAKDGGYWHLKGLGVSFIVDLFP
jgi:hypothetical protein